MSLRAGQGPGDYLQEYGVRRAAPPAVTPVATDTVARQPPSTVQVPQQPQVYDKQSRDAPRTVTGAQIDPPSHPSVTRVSSPQPWVQPAQWSTEPRPFSPPPRPPVVPSPVVFHTPLASPPTLVDTQQYLTPPRLGSHGPSSSHKESHTHTRDISYHSPTVNGRSPAPPVHSHTVSLPTAGSGQRASPQGASTMIHGVASSKHARHSSVPVAYADTQPPYVTSPRPIAPGLAAAFPIREDNADTYHQLSQGERPQDLQPSRDAYRQLSQGQRPQDPQPSRDVYHQLSQGERPQDLQPSRDAYRQLSQGERPQDPQPSRDAHHQLSQGERLQDPQPSRGAHRQLSQGERPPDPQPSRDAHRQLSQGERPPDPQPSRDVYHQLSQGERLQDPQPSRGAYRQLSQGERPQDPQPSRDAYHQLSQGERPQDPQLSRGAHRQLSQGERPQDPQPSRDAFDNWDRHRHNPDNAARMVVSTAPSSERTPRSTKASPNLHPRLVNQGTPPKPPLQPFDVPTFHPQSSTNPNVSQLHDSSRPGVYNRPIQNSNSSPYPATPIYPSSSSRTQVEANSAINNLPVASASPNNPSPKMKSGNPSPRSRSQVVASSQGPTPPVAVQLTTRTPSHETGSTTLLGQTPSSQGSVSMQPPMSPSVHPPSILPRVTTHVGQIIPAPAPVSDTLGDRNANAMNHTPVPTTRQTSARHYHSNSAPVVSVPSLAQSPPPVQSQIQPPARPAPFSPTPIRSYPAMQAIGDFQVARTPVPGYSTSVSNPRQRRDEIPSPSQESELNTPSSLAISTKLPIVSDEPLAPVISTQSYQEPKKKSGFFQGLGIFRSKSSAQKRHPHESKVLDSHAQKTTTTPTKPASSKPPTPLYYDSDSKVASAPSKLRKSKAVHTPVSRPAQSTPMRVPVPAPSFAGAAEEKFSSAPNAFASFRIVSKRYRTMSGASAEAVDGTNAGVCLAFSFF
jgi:hypothetical protein